MLPDIKNRIRVKRQCMIPCRLCPFTSQVLKYLELWEALDIAALVATMSKSSAQLAVKAQKHAEPVKQSKAILLLQRIVAGPSQTLPQLPNIQKLINSAQEGQYLSCCTSKVRLLSASRMQAVANPLAALCNRHVW